MTQPRSAQLGLFDAKPAVAVAESAITTANALLQRRVLSELDVALAQTLLDLIGENDPALELGIAVASWAVQRGHVCADLRQLAEQGFHDETGQPVKDVVLPEVGRWTNSLRQSQLVQQVSSDQQVSRPLLLTEDARLYLARYFQYEQRLARALLARSRSDALNVISGGPGTGKTYGIGKMLLAYQEQARARGEQCEVLLLAPTGKAAQRMGEALDQQFNGVPDEQRAGIPREASTIHRALGYQQKSPTRFRHDQQNPLSADVVVVDETSMVDLALMAKLVEAVRPQARLVLLGDKDQLASVEAGAIFGDICKGLRDRVVHLTQVHRYESGGAIAKLATLVNAGDSRAALDLLDRGDERVQLVETRPGDTPAKVLGKWAREHFGNLNRGDQGSTGEKTAQLLESLTKARFLCAHRRGPWGVEALNALVQVELAAAGMLPGILGNIRDGEWYEGRPILITENDYSLELFNGDVGVIARDDGESLVAAFAGKAGMPFRRFTPAQLPAHETVFAMSVHKAQGSELDQVALILPEQSSPVVTRELIYTAITRARSKVVIFGSRAVLAKAIETPVQRASGLSDLLWK
jgi:exodeoxyribonuclease V alpha subunit